MAVTQGTPVQVVNIGLGIKQLKVEPKGTPVKVYLESLSHKVSRWCIFSWMILLISVPANTGRNSQHRR